MSKKPSVDAIFCAAIEIDSADQRQSYLHRTCGEDAELRRQVERLLQAHYRGGSIMDAPAHALFPTLDQPPLEQPGSQIGPYKLLQEIGEGGMGVVYMAEQFEPIRRKVALKIIKPGMDTRQVIARFEAEEQALSLMDHPNIARVIDAGMTEGGRPFFVMELVRGQPITQYCDQHQLTPRQRLELFLPVCQAIQHAHQKGIIHRDIKPSNILVAEYDQQPVPKVIDFGVAKAISQPLTTKTMFTGIGQIVGTLEYMSPEQAHVNQLDIDTRTDVYALGVLLYELLTGTPPFDKQRLRSAAWDEMLRIIREEEPPKPSTRLTDSKDALPYISAQRHTEPAKLTKLVRGELDWIVMKALEKDRNRRYETANGLGNDLQRYLNDEPVQACPPTAGYRMRKFVRRNKGPLIAVGVILFCLVSGIVGTTFGLLDARRERDAAELARSEAVKAQYAETQQRNKADQAHALAEQEAKRAVAAETQAEQRAVQAEWRAYLANIAAAESATAMNRPIAEVQWRLTACPAHLRGWEWRWLMARNRDANEVLTGHKDWVLSALVSPNRERIVTISNDGTARVWDAKTGEERVVFQCHGLDVPVTQDRDLRRDPTNHAHASAAAFSPDGTRIVTASTDGTAAVWDANTGVEIAALRGHVGGLSSAAFSPDGKRIVTTSFDHTARIWNADSGDQLLVMQGPPTAVRTAAFSPNGKKVVTASGDQRARVWNAQTGKELVQLDGHSGAITSAAFSPDGTRIVTSSEDGTARLWDPDSGDQLAILADDFGGTLIEAATRMGFSADGRWFVHRKGLNAAKFSPDGARIVTASTNGAARIWDAKTGTGIAVLRGHTGELVSATFSPDGTLIVTASLDRTARVWDASIGAPLAVLRGHGAALTSAEFSPDGTRILTASRDRMARLWDVESVVEKTVLRGHQGAIGCATFSPDGKRVVTASWDQTARLWDVATCKEIAVFSGHTWWVRWATFRPDGRQIVTASHDGTARVWDIEKGIEMTVLGGRTVSQFATFSPDGATQAQYDAHQDTQVLQSAVFSPDGSRIVTASWNRTARVWDAETGGEINVLRGHTAHVMSAEFSPDGARIVTASWDRTARLWDADTGHPLIVLDGHSDWLYSAAFSPDGSRIVTASKDQTARVWDTATGDLISVLRGHSSSVASARFSPDGTRIVTASTDGTARIWDAASGTSVVALSGHAGEVLFATFSPDGTKIVTASEDGTARIWDSQSPSVNHR